MLLIFVSQVSGATAILLTDKDDRPMLGPLSRLVNQLAVATIGSALQLAAIIAAFFLQWSIAPPEDSAYLLHDVA